MKKYLHGIREMIINPVALVRLAPYFPFNTVESNDKLAAKLPDALAYIHKVNRFRAREIIRHKLEHRRQNEILNQLAIDGSPEIN